MTSPPTQTQAQASKEPVLVSATNGKGSEEITPLPTYLDVKEQLAFYASYHSNKYNVAIHLVCIPIILWSALGLLAHLTLPGSKPSVLFPGFAIQHNAALPLIVGYLVYYVQLEKFAAATYAPIVTLMYLNATYLSQFPVKSLPGGAHSNLRFLVMMHAFGWVMQFIGHGFAEKRAPALLDNLLSALVLAPFFSHLEFLFILFNYNPFLQREIKNRSGMRIKQMNAAARAKREKKTA